MGYATDLNCCQWIPPYQMVKSAGTWTPTLASNVYKEVRTTAAAAFNLFIPIQVSGNAVPLKNVRIKSIDVWWINATADLTSVTTVELEKMALLAQTVAVTGAAVVTTQDTLNDTTAKRITQASHKMTVTITTPEWVQANTAYCLYITFDCATTSALALFGAQVNYDLRV